MKLNFLFLFLFFYFGTIDCCSAQDPELKFKIDSLNRILPGLSNPDSFASYYHEIRKFEEWCKKKEHFSQIEKNNAYFNVLPQNKQDTHVYREALMRHGNKIFALNDNLHGAIHFYNKAHEYGAGIQWKDGKAFYIENQLGALYARLNEYNKAIYFYKLAIEGIRESKDSIKISQIYSNIGETYKWLRDSTNSINYYTQGLKIAKLHKNFKSVQSITISLADYFLELNNYKKASELILQSEIALTKIKTDDRINYRKSSINRTKGNYYSKVKEFNKSIKFYYEAIQNIEDFKASEKSRDIAKLFSLIANTYLTINKLNESNKAIRAGFFALFAKNIGGLPEKKDLYNENTIIELLDVKTDYYEKLNSITGQYIFIDSAIASIDLALEVNKGLAKGLVLNQSKFITNEYTRLLVEKGINLCYKFYYKSKNESYIKKAVEYFSLSKGQLLKESIENSLIQNNLSLEDRDSLQQLEKALIEFYDQAVTNDTMENIRLVSIEKIRTISNRYQRPVILEADIKEPYVEYLVTDSMLYINSNFSKDKFHKISISKSKLTLLIQEFLRSIQAKDDLKTQGQLKNLYKILFPFDIKGINKLKIIPDDVLLSLPFDLLKTDGKYLIESISISYQFQNKVIKRNKNKSDVKILSVFPVYNNESNQSKAASNGVTLMPLPNAIEEAKAVKEISFDDLDVNNYCSIDWLRKNIKQYSIFHFGGHAMASLENSYLYLTDMNGKVEDLSYYQIQYMSNDLDMVCLSACETGNGEVIYGEGLRSLASGFLISGAKSVVYSLWSVDERSTTEIMRYFYKNLNKGQPKDEALRNAKLQFIKECPPDRRSPYFWAGFCIVGDEEGIKSGDNKFVVYIIVLLLFLFLYLIIYRI